jgi:hypothetical protein
VSDVELATPRPWERIEETSDAERHVLLGNGTVIYASLADAALIVAAVNAYDRLRAIEAAARDFLLRWDNPERYRRIPAVDDLRAALDPAATEPEETRR